MSECLDVEYKEIKSGEWVVPVMSGYEAMCCDCGLVHVIDFKVVRRIDIDTVKDVEDSSLQVSFRARRL